MTDLLPPQLRRPAAVAGPALLILLLQMILLPMSAGFMLNGVIVGLLGALTALGLALIFRANRVVNFAQAEIGAYPAGIGVLLVVNTGLPYLAGLLAGLAAAIAVGAVIEIVLIRRFKGSPRLILTVATIGISQLFAFATGMLPRMIPPSGGEFAASAALNAPFGWTGEFGGIIFDGNDLIALLAAPAILVALTVFLRTTMTGLAIRASADRSDRAGNLGIPVSRIQTIVWIVATLLSFSSVFLGAGVSGFIPGQVVAYSLLLRAFAALVVGRFNDLPTIAVTSVALGVLESALQSHYGDTEYLIPILAGIVLFSLLSQRRGVSRASQDDTSSWRSSDDERPVPHEVRGLRSVVLTRRVCLLAALAVLVLLPMGLGTANDLKAGLILIFGMIGMSLVVLTGWAGQVSLGQMAFVGFGSAIGVAATLDWGLDPVVALFLSGAVGAVMAVLIGLPALRLKGLYLGLATFALAMAADAWIFNNKLVDWIPEQGMPDRPALLGRIDMDDPTRQYYLALFFLVVFYAGLRGIRRSRTGRVLLALRENDRGVEAVGVSVVKAKLTAFAISGFVAAVAGCLFAFNQASFRQPSYAIDESVTVFLATVVGGIGSLGGAVLGAVFLRGAQWLVPGDWLDLVMASAVLCVLLAFPSGLGGLAQRVRFRWLRSVAERHGLGAALTEDRRIVPKGGPAVDLTDGGKRDDEAARPLTSGAGRFGGLR